MTSLVVIDCGIGNVHSVVNACLRVGAEAVVVRDGEELDAAKLTHIILPGVGSVGGVMASLRERGLESRLNRRVIDEEVAFLGLCVGMQILAEFGEEFGECKTLGWIPGRVRSLAHEGDTEVIRLPHVGWNTVEIKDGDPLFTGIGEEHFYFVHSYAMECPDDYVIARTTYHHPFVSAVRKGHIVGAQFHPEKSSRAGEILLKNFLGT